jgi:hypothetical protein
MLPETMKVEDLDQQHPEYRANRQTWDDIELLFRGGHAIKEQAERFLIKRPKELGDVYKSRVERFAYQNIIGPALGWYQQATFETDPNITGTGEYLPAFLGNCDRSGTDYVDFWRNKVYPALLKFGCAWVLSDLPVAGEYSNISEQKRAGALDAFVSFFEPSEVINWDVDDDGVLNWALAHCVVERRSFGAKPVTIDRWYYFDRTDFAEYEAERKGDQKGTIAKRVADGKHPLAEQQRVPLRRLCVPDGLWIGDRVYLHALAHLNMQNAHYWGLSMSCLPQLYIKGDYEDSPTQSETSYYHLSENGEIGYAEPSGVAYTTMSAEIQAAREEIYRQMWLQAQGRSSSASASSQSGYSKEMDMAPSTDILNGYGKILRLGMADVLTDIADIRGEEHPEVTGLEFDDDDLQAELSLVQTAENLQIPSETLRKENFKGAARKMLRGRDPATIKTVESEIDTAPTREELAAQEEKKMRDRMRSGLLPQAA